MVMKATKQSISSSEAWKKRIRNGNLRASCVTSQAIITDLNQGYRDRHLQVALPLPVESNDCERHCVTGVCRQSFSRISIIFTAPFSLLPTKTCRKFTAVHISPNWSN